MNIPPIKHDVPLRPIQSTICNVRLLSVCVCVPSRKPHFLVDWRLLVKERIANIGMPPHISFYKYICFFFFEFLDLC